MLLEVIHGADKFLLNTETGCLESKGVDWGGVFTVDWNKYGSVSVCYSLTTYISHNMKDNDFLDIGDIRAYKDKIFSIKGGKKFRFVARADGVFLNNVLLFTRKAHIRDIGFCDIVVAYRLVDYYVFVVSWMGAVKVVCLFNSEGEIALLRCIDDGSCIETCKEVGSSSLYAKLLMSGLEI